MGTQERYADKIAKLLRKAEDPAASAAEAEAFFTKAQALMTEYAIDEQLLAKARGEKMVEKIIEEKWKYTGIYHQALFDVGAAVARANDCKVMIGKGSNYTYIYVIGHESDIARVRMLDTSLQIQAIGNMKKWWGDNPNRTWMSGADGYKARRQFIFSFAQGLQSQLSTAKKEGEKKAAEADVARGGEGEASVALVVRSKKQRVDEWYDEQYGKKTRRVSRNYAYGSGGAAAAGFDAGRRADVNGSGKIKGGVKGEIGR